MTTSQESSQASPQPGSQPSLTLYRILDLNNQPIYPDRPAPGLRRTASGRLVQPTVEIVKAIEEGPVTTNLNGYATVRQGPTKRAKFMQVANHGYFEGSGKVVNFFGERLDRPSTSTLASSLDEGSVASPAVPSSVEDSVVSRPVSSSVERSSMSSARGDTIEDSDEPGDEDASCVRCHTIWELVGRVDSVVLDLEEDGSPISEYVDEELEDVWLQIAKE